MGIKKNFMMQSGFYVDFISFNDFDCGIYLKTSETKCLVYASILSVFDPQRLSYRLTCTCPIRI